jgi:hypothetical protein
LCRNSTKLSFSFSKSPPCVPRWSASTLVTIAIMGCRCVNDASLSSASATRNSPAPRRALLAALFSRPPMTNVGSVPPSARMLAIRLVVVVLPCVPATAIE